MLKYGVTRNRLHKIITGTSRPGGLQYQQNIKKEMKDRPTTPLNKEVQVKTKTSAQAEIPKKGKGRGKSSTQKCEDRTPSPPQNTKPWSFSGLPKPSKVKYPRKACCHECHQSLPTISIMNACIKISATISLVICYHPATMDATIHL